MNVRTVFVALTWVVLALAKPAAAELSKEESNAVMARTQHQQDVEKAQRASVLAQCGLASASVQYPGWLPNLMTGEIQTWQTEYSVKAWSGGCLNGKRDGQGVLVTREDQIIPELPVSSALIKSEGRFVRGLQAGLWCTSENRIFEGAEFQANGDSGCRLFDSTTSGTWGGYLGHRADGRWEWVDGQRQPLSPSVILPAGWVEAESARLIGESAAGKTDTQVRVAAVQSNALDGLIAGTQIRLAADAGNVSLKGKRVALILSSRSIAEIERYTRERQALIDSTVNLPSPGKKTKAQTSGADAALEAMTGPVNVAMVERARFIDVSRPELLLKRVAGALRRVAGKVVPVEDLTGLTRGEFDYALVLDWQSLTRFDLLGKYKAVPVAPANQVTGASHVAGESPGGFLISPQLEAVRIYTNGEEFASKANECVQARQENTCDRDYLKTLADFFEQRWSEKRGSSDALDRWFQ